jgi:hypothetical protein
MRVSWGKSRHQQMITIPLPTFGILIRVTRNGIANTLMGPLFFCAGRKLPRLRYAPDCGQRRLPKQPCCAAWSSLERPGGLCCGVVIARSVMSDAMRCKMRCPSRCAWRRFQRLLARRRATPASPIWANVSCSSARRAPSWGDIKRAAEHLERRRVIPVSSDLARPGRQRPHIVAVQQSVPGGARNRPLRLRLPRDRTTSPVRRTDHASPQ